MKAQRVAQIVLALFVGCLIGTAMGVTSGTSMLQQALLELFCDACGVPQNGNLRNLVASVPTLQDVNTLSGSNRFSSTVRVGGTATAFSSAEQFSVVNSTNTSTALGAGIKVTNNGAAAIALWNADTSGDNVFQRFATGAAGTNRGIIDWDSVGGGLRINAVAGVNLSSVSLTTSAGEVGLGKITASGVAPGAAGGKFELTCGTNAGSAKIIAYAGTSATPVTVIDNIGSGVTGC